IQYFKSLYLRITFVGNNIEKKWRNVRDAFIRSLKEDKPKSGDGARKKSKKTYLYHDELRFLIKTITPRKTSSSINLNNTAYDNIENDTINDNDIANNTINDNIEHNLQTSEIVTEQCSTSNNSGLNKKKQSKQKESIVEKKFLEYLEVQTQKEINDYKQDQHQEFFNSLLPIVRKFNDD
ncbi:uncharacterized protein LOC111039987, partial [Myzus persicae]|uniref:uncharacterized protein LOC111039987 n=1 Tax=Myzus persicae TaxID=13164 RepID=UPI000B937CED